jgi:hypothetical protein
MPEIGKIHDTPDLHPVEKSLPEFGCMRIEQCGSGQ